MHVVIDRTSRIVMPSAQNASNSAFSNQRGVIGEGFNLRTVESRIDETRDVLTSPSPSAVPEGVGWNRKIQLGWGQRSANISVSSPQCTIRNHDVKRTKSSRKK